MCSRDLSKSLQSSFFYNNQIADLSQSMHKDFAYKNMSQSYLKQPSFQPPSPPANAQSFYQFRPSTNYSSYSPDRMNHSFIAPANSLQPFQYKPDHPSVKHSDTVRSCVQIEQKENTRFFNKEPDPPLTPFKAIEQRMVEVEKRLEKMEKQEKKNDVIAKNMEEVMQLQLKDIKINEELEERLNILEEMVKHLKTTKLDKKQLEIGEYCSTQALQSEIQELWTQEEANKNELKENKQRIQRLVNKIQTSVLTIGQKYEEFIESNIIKSVEQVNKLTHHYHEEIESFKGDYMRLKEKVQAAILEKNSQEIIKYAPPSLKMMEISLPNIKIIQSVTIINEKKGEPYSLFNNREPKTASAMASYKNTLISTLYDSIQKSTQSSCAELLLQKVVYKLDREFYLLDENDHYLVDAVNNRVRLTNQHIKILQENGLIE